MKFSIHGFYQPRAVELGLTNDDLLVLRWFVDFAGTNKMKTVLEADGIYYWINYATLLDDLPVLRITKDTLKRKHFDKLTKTNVLRHKHIKQGGSFSYYAYGINYDTLVYLQDNAPTGISSEGCDKMNGGGTGISSEGYGEIVGTKINLLNNQSINNKSIKDKEDVPYDEIVNLYHQICISFPKIIKLSDSRKKTIKARFLEYDKDINIFKTLFTKAENSNFLKGTNGKGWNANFDWLINPKNMIKVLEGNYDNKENSNASTKGTTKQDLSKYDR